MMRYTHLVVHTWAIRHPYFLGDNLPARLVDDAVKENDRCAIRRTPSVREMRKHALSNSVCAGAARYRKHQRYLPQSALEEGTISRLAISTKRRSDVAMPEHVLGNVRRLPVLLPRHHHRHLRRDYHRRDGILFCWLRVVATAGLGLLTRLHGGWTRTRILRRGIGRRV